MRTRNSNFELMRIIAMLFIVCFHCSFHGKFIGGGYGDYIINSFHMLGELGVNLFILISGYYYLESKFRHKKIIEMVIHVWFYVILCGLILVLCFNGNIFQVIKGWALPVLRTKYWFVTAYLLLYVFQPYLRLLIKVMDNRVHKELICIMVVVWSIIPSLLLKVESELFFNRFIWFVVLYIVGAFIRNNINSIDMKTNLCILWSTIIFTVAFIIVFTKLDISTIPGDYWWPLNSAVELLLSVSLFICFTKIDIKRNRLINYISSCTLGIYLLHDGVLRNVIWDEIIKTYNFNNGILLIFQIALTAILISIVGVLVDSLYKIIYKLIENTVNVLHR